MRRLLSPKWLTLIAVCLFVILLSGYFFTKSETTGLGGSMPLPPMVDYNFHIRPILSDKCFACHGPDHNSREADLRLDTEAGAYKALSKTAGMHAIVPGHPNQSEVYLRITSDDELLRMPPATSNLTLTNYEVKLIERWIRQGAEYKPHWAFIPPEKPEIPEVGRTDWPVNELDQFVLAKMKEMDFKPNPKAEKHHLLRRVCLDLTGLPPSEEQLDRFLADDSEEAYERMVDELLSSPAYGERMAMHWLDVARYADSYGYQDDDIRTQWPWRDWVIHAFNENMPYDEFVTWQLAGDMLPEATKEQILASAFNRNHKITEEGGVIEEEYRVAYAIDKTNTFSKGILGITMECAQCHDHKYDPFSQKNYFELYAFFNNSLEKGLEGLVNSGPSKTPRLTITQTDVENILQFINKGDDTSAVSVSVMGERDEARPTYILNRGLYDAPTERAYPGTPASILPFDSARFAPNRLGLAEWAFNEENPLTARVLVNQLWAMVFGRGLVPTVADFGNQGELPSHPELLDWLAADFRDNGWNIQRLLKQFVLSATYRQSSQVTKRHLQEDPENTYLARTKRLRLQAESIRDLALASSGLLNREIGGPSVKPYQPDGIWEVTSSGRGALTNYVQDHDGALYRRGMYVFIKLTVPPPNMLIFDASNRDVCEVTRQRTNTPLQALVMLNDPVILEASRVLSGRILKESSEAAPRQHIESAFRWILSREASEQELTLLETYHKAELKRFKESPAKAKAFLEVGEAPQEETLPVVEQAALMAVVHTLYNLEETITKI
ncbi:PSD1 and planctomycete cytochrome C domain-containing protein [Parapedobacter tibetensis]|uniref:PSD1 and planctomycete cytochrome C domain-containing protein n=1 Tax=Parapedobacter tibetensis TaxID=2972951 RepID=UPI00214D8E3C|nr:PSD1 and planctomycete cytochrome C domain-containing protein [Parapedobacter tibetensis]